MVMSSIEVKGQYIVKNNSKDLSVKHIIEANKRYADDN
jgi:hypothetical protein